ncbi:MAG TPA: NAD(P)H-binding protein [Microvirga sp.]|nr:NAD(P)H-binding protein [Microvirga sp.]
MKIGVSGASGHLGQGVLRQLATRAMGHEVIAISRTPEKAGSGVEGRIGDYDRPETLAQAYAGLDRLLIIPTSDQRPGKRGEQNVAAVTAAVRAGVGHIVFMSAAGTREQAEPNIGASYWLGEQALIKQAPRWTILRMNYYAEALAMEVASAVGQGGLTGVAENRVAFVAREDVAAAAAGILIGEGHSGAIYNATGTKAYTGAERAALISEITGKPVRFVAIPAEALRAGMTKAGLPEGVVDTWVSIQNDFAAGAFDIVTGDVERLAGRASTSLHEALSATLR